MVRIASEQKSFVFAVSFIILFTVLFIAIPTDLQGQGDASDELTPINPSALTDYVDTETWNTSDFVPWLILEVYEYTFDSKDWICGTDGATGFDLNSKKYWLGLWFGQLDPIRFYFGSYDRSYSVTFTEINADAEEGLVQYSLISGDGSNVGDMLIYWNSTLYSSSLDAWNSDALYFLHGVGISPNTNIIALLVGLLFLQLPEIPLLANILIVVPIWSSIIYIIWFIIKESLPFV